jgi:hypothetical protein
MSLAHSWVAGGSQGYGTAASAAALDELRAMGITSVALGTFAFMDDFYDHAVRPQTLPGTETLVTAAATARQAHARGLTVMLKPQVYLLDGEWCGDIEPRGGWGEWFESYDDFILAQARMAAEADIEMLVVGVELKTATSHAAEHWPITIAKVREVYHGTIIYSANWDEAEQVDFWPLVDALGISMYAPGDKQDWLRRYERVAAKADKPIVITETGIMNRIDARALPYVWPEWVSDEGESLAGDTEQAAGYEDIIATFGRSPQVQHIYWWKWFTDGASFTNEGPLGFSPRGRLAETVLRQTCAVNVSRPGRPSSRTSPSSAH